MALTDQMQKMVQQDIEDAATRPKEDILKEQIEGLKTFGKTVRDVAIESIPGVGEAIAEQRVKEAQEAGDKVGTAIEMAAMGVGAIPGVGDIVAQGIRRLKSGKIKPEPTAVSGEYYDAPSYGEFHQRAAQADREEGIKELEALRSTENPTTGIFQETIQKANIGNTRGQTAEVNNVSFNPQELQNIKGLMGEDAFRDTGGKLELLEKRIVEEGYKPSNITIVVREDGTPFIQEGNHRLVEALKSGREEIKADIVYLRNAEKTDGPFNPERLNDPETDVDLLVRTSYEMDKINSDAINYAQGGAVPMKEQMEMFEDGGLMDEGGTVDPVSGNDVPPGSTQEEVRDDIPAQLSEGEFVFPADVVRYIGLNKLMQMRQEAKMGLKTMEDMGQMGNSEEATIPDDIPFDINDLDMDEETDENNELEMQVGGFVPAQQQQQQQFGIAGYTPAQQPSTGFTQQPVQAASQQFVQQPTMAPAAAPVPTMQQYTPAEIPSFQQFVGGGFGEYDELREYKNEAGQTIQVPFKDGQPISPIPEGYSYVDPEATATEEVTTTPTTPQTTSVREPDTSDADERRRREEEEMFGPGGGRLGVGGETYGVSFDMPEGFIPGALGVAGTSFGLLSGKPLPSGVTVNFQRGKDKFKLTGDEYNRLKTSIDESGANSPATSDLLASIKQDALTREANKRVTEQERIAKETREQLKKAQQLSRDDSERDEIFDRIIKQKIKEATKEVAEDTGYDEDLGSAPTAPSPQRESDDGGGAPSGGGRTESAGADWSASQQSVSSTSGSGDPRGYSMRAEGGLMQKDKPKPKAKKMKRGGLASKK